MSEVPSKEAIKRHSIILISADPFGHWGYSVNTYDDWHLTPTSRPSIVSAKPKYKLIEVPGSSVVIDTTEMLNSDITYGARSSSIEFIVENGYAKWNELKSEISNYLAGKKFRAILVDDPAYFWVGRWSVNDWKSNNNGTWSTITLDYTLEPYKYWRTSTIEPWKWDPFHFPTDYTHGHEDFLNVVLEKMTITGEGGTQTTVYRPHTFRIAADYMPVTPTFTAHITDDSQDHQYIEVRYYNESDPKAALTFQLKEGVTKIPELIVRKGNATFTAYGVGTLTLDYRGGRL